MNDTWSITKFQKTNYLRGITADNNGYIYYTDGSETIYRVHEDMKSEPTVILQLTPYSWYDDKYWYGIVWYNNVLYICDHKNDKILMYSLDTGVLSTLAGISAARERKDGNFKEATFNGPFGITVDKNGDLYITDYHSVRKINLSEGIVTTIAGRDYGNHQDGYARISLFYMPQGIAVSEDGTIYVLDMNNNCVRRIQNNYVSTIISETVHTFELFLSGIALDNNGNLFIGCHHGITILHTHTDYQITSVPISPPGSKPICLVHNESVFLYTNGLIKLEKVWKKYERYLWIGCLKEEAIYCPLATLPRDIIKQIARNLSIAKCPADASTNTMRVEKVTVKQILQKFTRSQS